MVQTSSDWSLCLTEELRIYRRLHLNSHKFTNKRILGGLNVAVLLCGHQGLASQQNTIIFTFVYLRTFIFVF